MALTNVTVSNSCLYVVPIEFDEGYYLSGDATTTESIEHSLIGIDDSTISTNKSVIIPVKIQHAIAKPMLAGSFLSFSHRLLHWGSIIEDNAVLGEPELVDMYETPIASAYNFPRIALSTAFASNAFERPYFDHNLIQDGLVPLGIRLGLACGQQIQYEHMEPLDKHNLAMTRRIFHSQKGYFSDEYCEKISSISQMLTFIKRQERGRK
jgi:hypothetical protein